MYQSLGTVTLKTGETVDCGGVIGPDREWGPRVCKLLGHKVDPWNWQNEQCLTCDDLGIDVLFYILHRGGEAFANILVATLEGVGTFGHVFTLPADRRKQAMNLLMGKQMAHFREHSGRALYLGTGYDSAAYHIYKSHGFVGVESKSGVMDFYTQPRERFEAEFFGRAEDPTVIEPVGWRHWPAGSPLFCSPFGGAAGVVRMAGPWLFGRTPFEAAGLVMLRRNLNAARDGAAPPCFALRNTRTHAVLGVASWQWDATWPYQALVDVYCHPDHWHRAGEMLAALQLPKEAVRTIAYADMICVAKLHALGQAGFVAVQMLAGHTPADAAHTRMVDVMMLEKK